MYTIHDLCRISKLSRSTLLYYDSLGLLKPVERSNANYRYYSEESLVLLSKICLYREAGVSLSDIWMLIRMPDNEGLNTDILERTLLLLNSEAHKIREKQKLIIDMIKTAKDSSGTEDYDDVSDDVASRISQYAFDVHKALGLNSNE